MTYVHMDTRQVLASRVLIMYSTVCQLLGEDSAFFLSANADHLMHTEKGVRYVDIITYALMDHI